MSKVEFKNPELKSVDQLVLVHDGEKIAALVSQWQRLKVRALYFLISQECTMG